MREADYPRWLPWREPIESDEILDTPYHHVLVEVCNFDETGSRAVSPLEASQSETLAALRWRPMPWRLKGQRTHHVLSPDSIFRGLDGHLFHTIDRVCEQIFEGRGLDQPGCEKWLEVVDQRISWCRSRQIEYRHLVVPEHHSIYSDKIAGRPKPSRYRPILQILSSADTQTLAAMVYPLSTLTTGRQKYDTSYPHDVHLSHYGAFLVFRELLSSLPRCFTRNIMGEEELKHGETVVVGDVASALGLEPRRIYDVAPPPLLVSRPVETILFKNTELEILESTNLGGPTVVMFRTSNSRSLYPYFLQHFSRILAVNDTRIHFELLDRELPELVVTEIPERILAAIPDA